VVGADAWKQISPENQKIVRDLAVEDGRFASKLTIELGDKALEDVAAAGVTISEVDLTPFKTAVASVYDKLNLTKEAEIVKTVLSK